MVNKIQFYLFFLKQIDAVAIHNTCEDKGILKSFSAWLLIWNKIYVPDILAKFL